MRIHLVAVIVMAVFAGASYGEDGTASASKPADGTATSAGTTANSAPDGQDEMVCRRVTLTGTLLPGPRVCKSRKVWEQQQQNSKDLLDDATHKGLQGGVPGH